MKRKIISVFGIIVLIFSLSACGFVKQDDYDALMSDYESLQSDYDKLNDKYKDLKDDYNDISDDYDSLSDNYDTLKEENEDLSEQIEILQQELFDTVNSGSGSSGSISIEGEKAEDYIGIWNEVTGYNCIMSIDDYGDGTYEISIVYVTDEDTSEGYIYYLTGDYYDFDDSIDYTGIRYYLDSDSNVSEQETSGWVALYEGYLLWYDEDDFGEQMVFVLD